MLWGAVYVGPEEPALPDQAMLMRLDLLLPLTLHVVHETLQVANVDVRLSFLPLLEEQVDIQILLSDMPLRQVLHVRVHLDKLDAFLRLLLLLFQLLPVHQRLLYVFAGQVEHALNIDQQQLLQIFKHTFKEQCLRRI